MTTLTTYPQGWYKNNCSGLVIKAKVLQFVSKGWDRESPPLNKITELSCIVFFFLLAPSPLFCFLQGALLLCGQMTSAGSQISRCPLPAACRAVRHSNRKTHQTRPLMYCQYSNFALLGKDLAKETAVLFGAGPEGKFYV